MRRFLILLAILQLSVNCYAQEGQFFKADSARDVFAPRPDLQSNAKLEAFPRENRPGFMEPEAKPVKANFKGMHDVGEDSRIAEEAEGESSDPNLTAVDRIKLKHGDPTAHVPVKPIENAPAPMKGMYAAIEAGESELAFEYAKQWVRYFEHLKYMNKRFVTMTKYARKRESDSKNKSDNIEEQPLDEDKILYEQDLLEEEHKLSEEDLNQAAQRVIDEARNDSATAKSTSQAERIRLALKDQVPVDVNQRVDVMFFFDSEDETVLPIFQEVEKLFQSVQAEAKVNIVGLSINQTDEVKLASMSQKLASTFPLMSGQKAAAQFGVNKSPTFIFVTPSNGKSFVDASPRRFTYLDEVVKVMQGKLPQKSEG